MNVDYLLDDTGDLAIKNGDFIIGFSDDQHIEDILQSFQGEWKQFPLVGAAILTALNSQRPEEEINNMKNQLISGGYSADLISAVVDKFGNLRIKFPNGIKNA